MKGAVIIYYGVGHCKFFADRGAKITELLRSVPLRVTAIHCCYDNPLVRPLLTAASYAMDQNALCRLRFHYGEFGYLYTVGSR
jgi:hypothetical protein